MSGWGLAIDYGTSFSAAAVTNGDGVIEVVEVEDARRLASGVLVSEDGLLVGRTATNQARRRPERFERCPKRLVGKPAALLGGQAIEVVDMVAVVLERMVSAARTRQGGSDPDWVRLTHPASWRQDRLQVLREAGRRAGITDCELLSEPEAAAWYFVADRRGHEPEVEIGQCVAIYDLGGGTFDTAILRRGPEGFALVGAPGGDDWLGGEDFDQRLFDHVLGHVYARDQTVWRHLMEPPNPQWQRARMMLTEDVRTAKEALSSTPRFTVAVGEEQPLDIEVTRQELDDLIRDDLDRTVGMLDATIRAAGLPRSQIAALYLTGGSSRLPLVADLLTQHHPRTYTRPDPKTVVVQGATHRAAEDVPRRKGSGSSLFDDENVEVQAPPPPPPPPPPSPLPRAKSTRPLAGRARAASIALAVTVVSSLLVIVVDLLGIYVFGVAITPTSDVASDDRWLSVLASLEGVAFMAGVATSIVAGVVFLVWFHRAHRVLVASGSSPRHSPAWAVGSWFVPFVNLVIPKQAANDLWRAGSPDRVPGFVHAWWALWLTSNALTVAVSLVIEDVVVDGTPEALIGLYLVYVLASGLAIGAAVLAIRLVRDASRRLEALPGPQGPAGRPDAVSVAGATSLEA